ncbi:SLAM family member 9-like [Pipra filicauda]|uniref:SLAM family member 9-like n=1 Tax=Pipra filicauda TaxID=649802 RepID=A0A7R5L4Y4_9PASS|nr:SLAM family member 9-like [Pipra filicauda]
MDRFRFLLLALLALLRRATGYGMMTEVVGAEGGSVTFHIHGPTRSTAVWSFDGVPIVTLEFGEPPVALFADKKYETRFTFSEQGRALTISQLRMEDAGTYSAQSWFIESIYTLQVYRELAEPRVSCEAQNCSGGGCRYALHCSAPGPGLGSVSYGWSEGEQPRGEGPTVLLEESPPDGSVSLTCRAQNPVSNSSVTVWPGHLCAGNTTHPLPTGPRSSSLARVGAVAVAEAAALAGVFLVFYCRDKKAGPWDEFLAWKPTGQG